MVTTQRAANENAGDLDLGFDLQITETTPQAMGTGTWITGTVHGHRFEALVFSDHATNPDYEIAGSRISKLWLAQLDDRITVYNWDRGLDVAPANSIAGAIVDFLAEGLAELVYGA